MRKVLLMLALAMLGVALFASAALAQGVWTPPPSVNPTTGCPHMWVPLPSGECVPVSDPRATDDTPERVAYRHAFRHGERHGRCRLAVFGTIPA